RRGAWALVAVLSAVIDRIRVRHPIDIADNRDARRMHRQLAVLRGLGVVVISVIAAQSVLRTSSRGCNSPAAGRSASTTPFENWTRSSTELIGIARLDVDWRISPAEMRSETSLTNVYAVLVAIA